MCDYKCVTLGLDFGVTEVMRPRVKEVRVLLDHRGALVWGVIEVIRLRVREVCLVHDYKWALFWG